MSEKEIRAAIGQICDRLDLRDRAVGRWGACRTLFPFVLGAGLIVTACEDDTTDGGAQPPYQAPGGYGATTSTSSSGGAGGAGGAGGVTGTGGAGGEAGSSVGGAGGSGGDGGGQYVYMAPDP